MGDMGLRHDVPTRKSARIVGEVLGKYHPHGDTAVYDAMVRMAQDFSMRYPLVEGQGNFGSVDGDSPAAMRYTEARLAAMGEELLLDLDKNTVDVRDNFDASLQEPEVLPARLPNLILNGVSGIAVGMATNIPPHNLQEVADAVAYLVDHYDVVDDISVDDLMQFVQGPDFPTGGSILGCDGIRQAYATGKGRVVVRASAHIEDMRGHSAIVITELPYQVNKAGLVERIADLSRNGRVEGIADLRDESDRTGMRVVIELKRGLDAGSVLGQLLKLTQLQTTFGVNMLALVDGEPRSLSLKRALLHYIDHRHEVLVRRSQYELEKARARAHILEALLKALDQLDEVIDTIRRSRTADTALTNLQKRFGFSEIQARAILDMQLRRLAALERQKLQDEYKQILNRIAYLEGLLQSKKKILELIKEDMLEIRARYGDARRTRICAELDAQAVELTDLTPDENLLVMLTRNGSIRRLPTNSPQAQARDDQAVAGIAAQEGVALLASAQMHSREMVVFCTDRGNAALLPAHLLPDARQQERGLPLRNLVALEAGENVITMHHLESLEGEGFLTLVTRGGKVKRLVVGDLLGLGGAGQVLGLADDDSMVWAGLTSGSDELIVVTEGGRSLRFQEETVRPQGRPGTGVRAITLVEDDVVAGVDLVRDRAYLVLITRHGYAKRTAIAEYPIQGRGGQGTFTLDANKLETTGSVVGVCIALPQESIVVSTASGAMHRVAVSEVRSLARASWGRVVTSTGRGRLIKLEDDTLTGLVRLEAVAEPDGVSETKRPAKRSSRTGGDSAPGNSSGSSVVKRIGGRVRRSSRTTDKTAAEKPK